MKKSLAVLLALGMLLAFAACGKEEEEKAPALEGGWTETEEGEAPSESERETFAKAVEGTAYADYTLVSTLGKQVVAGMNYKFLAEAPDGTQKLVIVFRDLEDACEITYVGDYE